MKIDIGTHDILDASVREVENNLIEVSLNYLAGSVARGALLNYVGITDGGEVDIERSVLLTLNRSASSHGNLSPGEYRVFIYDIGHDGMLEVSDGVSYPAVRAGVEISDNSQGNISGCLLILAQYYASFCLHAL